MTASIFTQRQVDQRTSAIGGNGSVHIKFNAGDMPSAKLSLTVRIAASSLQLIGLPE
jgi:hypothetical protein